MHLSRIRFAIDPVAGTAATARIGERRAPRRNAALPPGPSGLLEEPGS